ncbi:MAG: hypothetical protein NTX03_06680 [Bacteroidetes bacterium]|nr:hypothetical protein [Bacteroidota bacterium]
MKKNLIIFLAMSFIVISCRNNDKRKDVQKVDALINIIKSASDILVIDDNVIRERIDSIGFKIKQVKLKNTKIDSTSELASAIIIMEGIRANYKQFLEEYPAQEFDNQKFADSVGKLRSAVLDDELYGEKWDKVFIEMRKKLNLHLDAVKKTSKLVYEVEKNYQRKDEIIKAASR